MGKESQVRAVLAGGSDEGRLQYEPPKLIFRGRERLVFTGEALAGVKAEAADLVLADGSRFTLGEKAAVSWAEAIARPKGRLDKLGVKPGLKVGLDNLDDPGFLAELDAAGIAVASERSGLDLLFYGADSAEDLARAPSLIPALADRGALWVISLKGKPARIKDLDVFAALRPLGLADTKVCAFSEARTALRFVRRR
ncbi:DUF3052 domain-containing protein [Phenylobacterium montanum]|uniref:DUF3052 domain-containing protein n=1 Tax=Phenylobacterium montanum TaxID=2823693 RepID=A0A975G3A1_9CAUL|nr:DUF3052 domain-containing protein [Caulobacter sp. S6]QUD89754.1 DUF3052 domain-containing protein [Caulobacter sp. S6]